jgi:outer membrane protein assembly factor BamB
MLKHPAILLISVSVLLLNAFDPLIITAAPKDNNWSQWRGSDGTGVSSETDLPVEWSSSKNIKWKTPRKVQASWTTPLIVRTPQRAELITSGNELIISYDPKTGKEWWRTKGHASNAIASPLVGHGMVFISAGFPLKRTLAIKLGTNGELDSLDANIVWRYNKGSAYVPSPILYGDYLYVMTDRGILTCLDAKTGKVIYEGARLPVPATFTASPVAVDGKILLTSEDGDTFIIKAGPQHEVLATNSIEEPVFASPAISNGMIFIRGEKHLYCIGKM